MTKGIYLSQVLRIERGSIMHKNRSDERLGIERAFSFMMKKFHPHRIPFFAALIVGFLTYGYAFANKLINHDEAYHLFTKGATIESGRWSLALLSYIFPDVSMPWIYGILTIVLMALSACVIIKTFEIRRPVFQVLIAGLIIAFPSLIGTFGYMYTTTSYGVAFLMASLAMMLVSRNTLKSFLIALGLMVFSLGIYQSYVAVAASLLVLLLIQRSLYGQDIKKTILQGVRYILLLGISLAAYYGLMILVQKITNIPMGEYASKQNNFKISEIFFRIKTAYFYFVAFFTQGFSGLIPTVFSRAIHFVLLAMAGVIGLFWAVKTKNILKIGFLLALAIIFPLAVNCMYLFTSFVSVHTLVLYSFISLYVLIVVMIEYSLDACDGKVQWQKIIANTAVVCLAIVVVVNTYIGNMSFLRMHLAYENTYSFYTSVWTEIRTRSDFDENTKLAVVGEYNAPSFYSENFSDISDLRGIGGILPNSYSKDRFLEYYIGVTVPFAEKEEINAIMATEEYEQMPAYPYSGCISKFGDVLVVKLG